MNIFTNVNYYCKYLVNQYIYIYVKHENLRKKNKPPFLRENGGFLFFVRTATESVCGTAADSKSSFFSKFQRELTFGGMDFQDTILGWALGNGSGPGSWKGVKIGKLPFWIEVGGLKKWPVIWCHYISIHSSSRYYHPISEKFG